nr:TPA_asm: hypothetical protein HUJ06_011046 [Nelumbo nucifera]
MLALKCNHKYNKPTLGKNLKIKTLNLSFDFVIANDVVYIEESVGPLVSAMEALVWNSGVVLLGYQLRSLEAHRLFWELCKRVFTIEKMPHKDLHPVVQNTMGIVQTPSYPAYGG